MTAHDLSAFIQGDRLTAIAYTTADRPETVHPQVMRDGAGWAVYGRAGSQTKRRMSLLEFAQHFAASTPGLALRGIRPSDGRATSISFSQSARLQIDPAFLAWARQQAI